MFLTSIPMLRLAILFPVVKVCDSLQPMAVLEVFPPFFRVANANMMPSPKNNTVHCYGVGSLYIFPHPDGGG